MNFLPIAIVPLDLGSATNGRELTIGIRPESIRIVGPDAPDATIRAAVTLVEPLGAKDVVHFAFDGRDVRAIGTPGERPRIGESVGLAFDAKRVHLFDDSTGQVVAA
jgi:multiple sugar transport system ATP-binding protein